MEITAGSGLLELADEPDLGVQLVAELLFHAPLRCRDQLANIGCGGMTPVDHDVGVHGGNLGVTDPKPFHAQLVDETAGATALDLLEDRSSARMPLEPRMLSATPAEVLLHDALEHVRIGLRQLEC